MHLNIYVFNLKWLYFSIYFLVLLFNQRNRHFNKISIFANCEPVNLRV